jgi:hypothetical protein
MTAVLIRGRSGEWSGIGSGPRCAVVLVIADPLYKVARCVLRYATRACSLEIENQIS